MVFFLYILERLRELAHLDSEISLLPSVCVDYLLLLLVLLFVEILLVLCLEDLELHLSDFFLDLLEVLHELGLEDGLLLDLLLELRLQGLYFI